MIGNKLEQSIVSVFQENLSETFSINSISKILKKSYPNINKKSNFLLKEGILGKINIGNSYQCYLNLNNDKAKVFIAMNEINKRDSLIQKNKHFENIIEELYQLNRKFRMSCALLYKKSIIIIMNDMEHKKEILDMSVLTKDFNLIFFDVKSFQEYFLTNEDLQKYHHVILNTENYVNILSELNDRLLMRKFIDQSRTTKINAEK
jgi:hypothetical protein